MKYSLSYTALTAAVAVTSVFAAPAAVQKRAACDAPVTLSAETNPFLDNKLYANPYYAAEITAAIGNMTDETLIAQAQKVAEVGSFKWIDTISVIPTIDAMIKEVPCGDIIGLIIYDLPGRDCAAKASNGELAVGELERYKTEYIDPIVEIFKANPNTAIALIIEPDSLPNLVTNIDLVSCQESAEGYESGVAYALEQLNLPNVVMYVDAGHGGWLGWDENLTPGAEGLAKVYKAAGSPSQVRGIATNISGWNAFKMTPGEFENDADGQYNQCQDEDRFITIFGEALATAGHPNHAITDTGRNAVQGLRLEWGDWCNVIGAGFGARPTTETGNELCDAFVWGKPGGESDGTSDTTADRYDSFCGHEDAFKPSPEAGAWHQEYFEMLLKNADPQF